MNRITMCLEGDTSGKVLAQFDLDEFAEKIRTDERKKIMDMIDSADDNAHAMYLLSQYIIGEELKENK